MSIKKFFVPSPDELIKNLKSNGFSWLTDRDFDVLAGSPLSVDIVETVIELSELGFDEAEILQEIDKKILNYDAKPNSV
jgi:hypothetical protein